MRGTRVLGSVTLLLYGALMLGPILYIITLKWRAAARLYWEGSYDETQRTDPLNAVPFR